MKKISIIILPYTLIFISACVYSPVAMHSIPPPHESKINLELFVMSQCPFSVEAEKAIIPVLDQFKDRVDFKMYFITYEAEEIRDKLGQLQQEIEILDEYDDSSEVKCRGIPDIEQGAKFYSLHGQQEVEEDIRQLVIMTYYPDKFLDYIMYRAENYASNDWEEAAAKAWIDIKNIQELTTQLETEMLFRSNIKKAYEMQIESSPTLYINGKIHKGQIDQFTLSRYICKNGPRCKQCKDIPVCGADQDCQGGDKVGLCLNPNTKNAQCKFSSPVDIQLTVIRDTTSDDVTYNRIKEFSKSLFPKLSITELDYTKNQANQIIDKYGINILPAYIFSQDLERSLRFIRIQNMLNKKEDAYIVKSKYLARSYCTDREERDGQLDLFIESLSKAGNYLEKEIMIHPFFNELDLNIHFWAQKGETKIKDGEGQAIMTMAATAGQSNILYLTPQQPRITFKSTKGLAEIQEDIRQLLIVKNAPEKYSTYLSCMNETILSGNGNKDWTECVKASGIEDETIASWKMNGKGVELLLADIELCEELGLEFSPAILIDNKILLRNFTIDMLEQEVLNLE